MHRYSLIAFILIGSFCSIGLFVYFIASDQVEIDANLNNLDTNSTPKDKLANNNQSDLNIKANLEDKLKGLNSKPDEFGIDSDDVVNTNTESEIISKGEEKGRPWYDDGKPGISRAELFSMHEYQTAMIEQELNNPDAIVIEATDTQLAVTRAELKAMHAEQMRQFQEELNNPDAIVIEATDDQPAVTRGELKVLHTEQIRQINEELNNSNSIVIDATDDQPAVTRGELVALHEEQLWQMGQMRKDPDAPAIENEDGKIVTNQEIEALHLEQKYQMLKSQFNADAIVMQSAE